MSKRTRTRNEDPRAGFTLIEPLISILIVAISLGSIGMLAASSLEAGRRIERRWANVESARAIMTGLPPRSALETGVSNGRFGDRRWRLETAPYRVDFIDPNSASPWSARAIILSVQDPDGSILRVDSVRLSRRIAK